MKTVEEWKQSFRGLLLKEGDIEQIQLDAMKEGMRRAAEETATYMGNTVHESHSAQYILTAAEQLTEKDL